MSKLSETLATYQFESDRDRLALFSAAAAANHEAVPDILARAMDEYIAASSQALPKDTDTKKAAD